MALLVLCLSACASAPQKPPAAQPDTACWRPSGAPRAVVVGVHGLNDYHNAFADIAVPLTQAGLKVCSYDQPGFGATPQRGEWAGEAALIARLAGFVDAVSLETPQLPVYVLAESMGGAVAIKALADHPGLPVDGLILSAPAVVGNGSDGISPISRWLVHVGALLLPDLALERPSAMALTDEPGVARHLAGDPMILQRTRLPVLDGLLRLMHTARADAVKVRLPTLLLYGRHDPLVPPSAIRYLADHLAGPVRQVPFPAGHHLLLRGNRARVTARPITAWIDARLAAGGQGLKHSAGVQGIADLPHNRQPWQAMKHNRKSASTD